MTTAEQWLQKQGKLGRYLYLVLDFDGQLDERDALLEGHEPHQYGNPYSGTPASSLAAIGPYLFRFDTLDHPAIQVLLKSSEHHWGWLASSVSNDLESLARHWRTHLVTGERSNRVLYRFHDGRVSGRALVHLQPGQRPMFLRSIPSACYWLAGRWLHADNPAPGDHLASAEPAWLVVPTVSETAAGIQFDNAWRYLIAEWTEPFAELAEQRDVDAWFRAQLELARTWGWRASEQICFLLLQRLFASDDVLPRSRLPLPDETPATYFERVHQEVRFWQGGVPVRSAPLKT